MATRTAPDVTGVVTGVTTSLHLVDASGDLQTESITGTAVPLAADVQAWATQYQLASQASLYSVTQTFQWTGDRDPDNADVGQRNSLSDGVNLLWRNIALGLTEGSRVMAPVPAIMQGNQDIPLLTAAPFPALIAAYAAILSGYSLESAQFTGRRERKNNPRINV